MLQAPYPAGCFIVLKSILAALDPGAGAFSIISLARACAMLTKF